MLCFCSCFVFVSWKSLQIWFNFVWFFSLFCLFPCCKFYLACECVYFDLLLFCLVLLVLRWLLYHLVLMYLNFSWSVISSWLHNFLVWLLVCLLVCLFASLLCVFRCLLARFFACLLVCLFVCVVFVCVFAWYLFSPWRWFLVFCFLESFAFLDVAGFGWLIYFLWIQTGFVLVMFQTIICLFCLLFVHLDSGHLLLVGC